MLYGGNGALKWDDTVFRYTSVLGKQHSSSSGRYGRALVQWGKCKTLWGRASTSNAEQHGLVIAKVSTMRYKNTIQTVQPGLCVSPAIVWHMKQLGEIVINAVNMQLDMKRSTMMKSF